MTVNIDRSAPRVTTAIPTGKGVAPGTNAKATFSERMNRDSITAPTFKVFKCSSTTSTDCPTQITKVAFTKSTDGLSATLNPFGSSTTRLAKNTKYKVVVTTGVTDEAGNALDQNATTSGNQRKVWYFTTGSTQGATRQKHGELQLRKGWGPTPQPHFMPLFTRVRGR